MVGSLAAAVLRVLPDLDHAEVVFREALEIAHELDLASTEPGLLLRMAHVALERERFTYAIRCAQEAIVGSTALDDREGQGRGFQVLGLLRYYMKDYRQALRDLGAALGFLTDHPPLRLATHQVAALCYAAMGRDDDAVSAAAEARALADAAPRWMAGNISWLEARLTYGTTRLDHLRSAQRALCRARPADCALVTVELIEEALSQGLEELAGQEVVGLCALVEKTGSPRIEKAILRLVRQKSRLTPDLIAEIRRSLDRARERRLSTVVVSDL